MHVSKPGHRRGQEWEQFLQLFNEKYVMRVLEYKNGQEPAVQVKTAQNKGLMIGSQLCRNSQLIVFLLSFQKRSKTHTNWFYNTRDFLKTIYFHRHANEKLPCEGHPGTQPSEGAHCPGCAFLSKAGKKNSTFFLTRMNLSITFQFKSLTKN